ncbi:MAG: hypothetical protein KAI79_17065 [Bacteroidales bacterium]|nr:hypothetical protein [Bacteroidales bacterium]
MNIEDLENDIAEMEANEPNLLTDGTSKNTLEYLDMCEIASAYYEDHAECEKLIEKFREFHGYKINIL